MRCSRAMPRHCKKNAPATGIEHHPLQDMITIYHNPRCSKSREALQLVQDFAADRKLALRVVDYQQTPLTLDELQTLCTQLGEEAADMVRSNEEEYAALNLAQADADTLLKALAQHPRLLQRPVVEMKGRAMIARPPEKLAPWLENLAG